MFTCMLLANLESSQFLNWSAGFKQADPIHNGRKIVASFQTGQMGGLKPARQLTCSVAAFDSEVVA